MHARIIHTSGNSRFHSCLHRCSQAAQLARLEWRYDEQVVSGHGHVTAWQLGRRKGDATAPMLTSQLIARLGNIKPPTARCACLGYTPAACSVYCDRWISPGPKCTTAVYIRVPHAACGGLQCVYTAEGLVARCTAPVAATAASATCTV